MSSRDGHPVGPPVPDWSPREPARATTLSGHWVRLEPLSVEHVPALLATLGDPADADLWAYRPTTQPRDPASMTAVVEAVLADPGAQTMVAVPVGGVPSGLASYLRIEPAHGQVEVGGVLWGRAMRRTPASTEAIHLLMAHAFDDLGYRRFEWKCDSLNEPSRRAATRLGFAYEGTFRQHLVIKGHNRDTAWFAVTDDDWPAVGDAHRRWLDPANFDDVGHQRTPLRPRFVN